ncbi:putative bifunctional diguanylate cyclase/phosphodiesterase [Thiomicrorhabdus lithotrophica]|uniref:EAL domain-containing protein n=1 Tax=Thiomicrorhabdus lithotrophica TaxID=2949997 RepID=A0ABY8C9C3_9GAMM|nr:bifunctional diguanylate cyclase/phosphodiesterase [Thiomicrorhabdus lithotrophica]WEJ61832.1 EAL domain-containing protein [Thiomicrorhabdus lithotrophica]
MPKLLTSIRLKLLLFLSVLLFTLGLFVFNYFSVNESAWLHEKKVLQQTNLAIELSYKTKSSFASQLHAWKNILLRGHIAKTYHSHLKDFYQLERETRSSIKALKVFSKEFPQITPPLNKLQASHKELGQQFRNALRTFNETDIDPGPATDKFLQGYEEIPITLLNDLVTILQIERNEFIKEIELNKAEQQERLLISSTILLLLLSAAYYWLLDRRIAKPAEQATQLSSIINHAEKVAKFGTWDWDSSTQKHHWSEGFLQILNLEKRAEQSFAIFLDKLLPSERKQVEVILSQARHNMNPFRVSARLNIFHDGKPRYIELRGQVTKLKASSNHVRITSIIYDITDRVEIQDQLELYLRLFEHTGEPVLISNSKNEIIKVNRAFEEALGYKQSDLIGKDPKVLASGKTDPQTYESLWRLLKNNISWHGELWNRHENGKIIPFWATISPIRNNQNEIENYIANYSDISQIKDVEARIHKLAHQDSLTGLLNRLSLEDRLKQSISEAKRNQHNLAVLFLDMDRFKIINDTIGHHAGDEILIQIAHRLKSILRESDIISRIGGDEFVIALPNYGEIYSLKNLIDKIINELRVPYMVDGNKLVSTPSLGISLYPEDGTDSESLMKNADTAMYSVKEHGRNSYQFFKQEMNDVIQMKLILEQELLNAIEQNEFCLYYQPQICGKEHKIIGLEALIRWQHPEKGLISPDFFIPIAEESGLIIPISQWVLHEAIKTIANFKEFGFSNITMAINISQQQFKSESFHDEIARTLKTFNIPGRFLELEITESQAMENAEQTIEILHGLKKLNVSIALDDFGTGYSSLAYLKRLPIDIVKVDRSFIQDIEHDSNDAEISSAAISLSHNLGLKVIAEGVETETQLAFLKSHNCDVMQGYFFSRPLPENELLAWMKSFAS